VRSGPEEVIAAVNMAAHTSMISSRLLVEMLGPQLVETAGAISARLRKACNGELIDGNGNGRRE
jgi:DNA-binding IclR family transcriptional regulator